MTTGYLPVRQSAYESETYQAFMATDATATAAYAQVDALFASPYNFDGSYEVRSDVDSALEELFAKKADGQTALEKVVATINADVK
jgi:multiple sugar transport system substrate-binding protein